MARRPYEGSAADQAEDARGEKATGMSPKQYEKSARDKREDAAGQKRINVTSHSRKPAGPPKPKAAPMPGQFDFDAGQEQAMRAGRRAQNQAQAAPQPAPDVGDDNDMDEGGI